MIIMFANKTTYPKVTTTDFNRMLDLIISNMISTIIITIVANSFNANDIYMIADDKNENNKYKLLLLIRFHL